MLVVTHDFRALRFADLIYQMEDGAVQPASAPFLLQVWQAAARSLRCGGAGTDRRCATMLKWTTIGLSLAGLTAGIYVVGASAWHAPVEEPARPAIVNPYPDGIAASGVIEGRDRNVRIAAPESGLVWKVFVRPNDKVSAGAPLFQLDPRPLQADLARAQAAIGVAEQTLKRSKTAPTGGSGTAASRPQTCPGTPRPRQTRVRADSPSAARQCCQ